MSWWTGDKKWRLGDSKTPPEQVCQRAGCGVVLTLMREQDTNLMLKVCQRCGDANYIDKELADSVNRAKEAEWKARASKRFSESI